MEGSERKSQVHKIYYRFFMNKGIFDCDCPVRLDSDTVSLMLTRIVNMFNKMGCGSFWNIAYGLGNPLHQVE